jgi:hypothetical protein
MITQEAAKIGMRARFTALDPQYRGAREGKVGTIVTDADLNADEGSTDFGGSSCGWQADGEVDIYITALADLTEEV